MDSYARNGNGIDWLFAHANAEELLRSTSDDVNVLGEPQSLPYSIDPGSIAESTTSYELLLNTPSERLSSPALCNTYPHALPHALPDELGPLATNPTEVVPPRAPKASNPGKRQRTREPDTNDLQLSLRNDDARTARVAWQLVDAVPIGHPLSSIGAWPCNPANCFARTPLNDRPLDYYKGAYVHASLGLCRVCRTDSQAPDPLLSGKFAVHIFDPSEPPLSSEFQVDSFTRPSGRSVHLIVTELPHLADASQLNRGFAVVVAARHIHQSWQAVCMVSFEGSTVHKTRMRTNEISFRGNLEHCTGQSGQRFWGQRSSHVRKTQRREGFKPLRIEPKGPVGVNMVEEYCFFVSLFDEDGSLLKHVDGRACLARTNVVRFEPKNSRDNAPEADARYASLMREINKLSILERADLSAAPFLEVSVRTLLNVMDKKVLDRLGVKTYSSEKPPESARELSSWMPTGLAGAIGPISEEERTSMVAEEYKIRVRAVARQIGRQHADPCLVDTTERTFDVGNTIGAESRYSQILAAGIDDTMVWLNANGITRPNIHEVAARAELAGFVIRNLRFKSTWTISLSNVYPDRILVDTQDAEKVHCLANTTYESEISLHDRVSPLARFAYCSKVRREDIKEMILVPYCHGFLENFPAAVQDDDDILRSRIGPPYSTTLIDEDKFFIALHLIFLDYFLYWTRFRSVQSVKRIAERLLEDDDMLSPWFFEPSRLVRFS